MQYLLKILSVAFRAGLVVIFLLAGGGLIDHIRAMDDTPPHDMVEIENGRRLHALCEGPGSAPLVLYDAGAFGIYADGWWVKEALKDDFRVCLYDRAGMGWSDPAPAGANPTIRFHVDDMRALADALDAKPPFYLVGHSMAGIRLHAFTNLYPDDVAGLVFVDAAAPHRLNNANGERLIKAFARIMTVGVYAAQTGIARAFARFAPDELKLPATPRKAKTQSIASVRHHKAAREEVRAAPADIDLFGTVEAENKPVAVFNATPRVSGNADVAEAALKN
ncbi:MAG: alpha/beta hydrolase, partial [Pseudomonadota bacterium]